MILTLCFNSSTLVYQIKCSGLLGQLFYQVCVLITPDYLALASVAAGASDCFHLIAKKVYYVNALIFCILLWIYYFMISCKEF